LDSSWTNASLPIAPETGRHYPDIENNVVGMEKYSNLGMQLRIWSTSTLKNVLSLYSEDSWSMNAGLSCRCAPFGVEIDEYWHFSAKIRSGTVAESAVTAKGTVE
jgi:hypothetical protein